MLQTISLLPDSLENVTDEIAELLAPQPFEGVNIKLADANALQFPSYDLTETFEVWAIDYDDLVANSGDGPARQITRFSNRWHHQIREDEKVIAYARSVESEIEKMALHQFIDSPLARTIDDAITILDDLERTDARLRDDDSLVRLLVIPAFQAHAFWLAGETSDRDWVLFIEGPDQFDDVGRKELLSLDSFIQLLRTLKPAAGLTATL